MGSIWEGSGRLLGALWALLGASWVLLFAFFVVFLAYVNSFFVLVTVAIFGPKMILRVDFGRVLGWFGRVWEGFWKDLGRFWGGFGEIFERIITDKRFTHESF